LKPDAPAITRILNDSAPGWMAVSRGAALGLSCLVMLNLMEVFVYSTSAADNWLTNLQPLTQSAGIACMAMFATSLLMFALRPALPAPVLLASLALLALFVGFIGKDLWQISQHVVGAPRTTAMIAPLGIFMLLAVTGMGILAGNTDSAQGRSSLLFILLNGGLTLLAFGIVTVQSGRLSDALPETSASVILVSRSIDGSTDDLSVDLSYRLQTASQLLLESHGKLLVVFGTSPEPGESVSDPVRTFLLDAGVAESQILADVDSSDAAAALKHAAGLPQLQSDRRIIVIGEWHELARIRLLAKRLGLSVTAVPAKDQDQSAVSGMKLAQEIVALAACLTEPAIRFLQNSPQPAAEVDDAR